MPKQVFISYSGRDEFEASLLQYAVKEMTERIFVSYAHQDRDLVKGVLQALRKRGFVTAEDVVILDHGVIMEQTMNLIL